MIDNSVSLLNFQMQLSYIFFLIDDLPVSFVYLLVHILQNILNVMAGTCHSLFSSS